MKTSRLSPLLNLYSRFGPHHRNLPPGISLYSTTTTLERSPPSTSHITTDLYSRIITDPNAPVYPILDQWVLHGQPVHKPGFLSIINHLKQSNRFDQALEVSMWMTQRWWFELSPAEVALRLKLIAKVHGIERAEAYADSIPQSVEVHSALLSCYADAELVEKAEAAMQKVRELRLAATASPYNDLLGLYCRIGKRDRFNAVVEEMEEKGVKFDKFTYRTVLGVYAADLDYEAVKKVVAQWESHGDCGLDRISYAVVGNVYIKEGNVDKALAMLRKCEELIPVDSRGRRRETYEHLMPQYAALGKKGDVVRLWEAYKGQIKVDDKGYRIMISSLLIWESTVKILTKWESKQSVYDVPSHLVTAYSREGLLDKADAIIKRVILKSVQLDAKSSEKNKTDAKSWYSMAKEHLDRDQTENAVELTKKALLAMQPGSSLKTDKDVWAACLKYLVKKPDLEGAKEYIKLLGGKNLITMTARERLLSKISTAQANSVTAGRDRSRNVTKNEGQGMSKKVKINKLDSNSITAGKDGARNVTKNVKEAIIKRVILKSAQLDAKSSEKNKTDAKSWYSMVKEHLDRDQTEKAVELTKKALLAMQPGSSLKTDKDVWAACLNYLVKKPDLEGAKEYIKLLGGKNLITMTARERLLSKISKAQANSVTAGRDRSRNVTKNEGQGMSKKVKINKLDSNSITAGKDGARNVTKNVKEAIIKRVILKSAQLDAKSSEKNKTDAKSWYSMAKEHLDRDQTEKAVELTKKALLAMQPGSNLKTDKDVWAACLNYLVKKPDLEGAKEYIKLLCGKNLITMTARERLLSKISKAQANSVTAGPQVKECDKE